MGGREKLETGGWGEGETCWEGVSGRSVRAEGDVELPPPTVVYLRPSAWSGQDVTTAPTTTTTCCPPPPAALPAYLYTQLSQLRTTSYQLKPAPLSNKRTSLPSKYSRGK